MPPGLSSVLNRELTPLTKWQSCAGTAVYLAVFRTALQFLHGALPEFTACSEKEPIPRCCSYEDVQVRGKDLIQRVI